MNYETFKLANRNKDGSNRMLILKPCGQNYTEAPANLQPSNLWRLQVIAHDTTGGKTRTLTGNIPLADLPAIMEAAKAAFVDSITTKNKKFSILEAQLKPKRSDVNEEGTLLYSVGIEYDSARTYPITVTVKNNRGTVTEKDDGTLRIAPTGKEQYISTFASAREFYNKLKHTQSICDLWYNSAIAEFFE